ncbi:MAG: tripartite tricarboxylate transporter permease [Tagaea sp.]|nr:tripartite tricarboxylate transporter permease [Tagaea sp.]
MEHLATAFLGLANPPTFAALSVGVFLGIVVGALPGMTGGMLMALALPFTFYMSSIDAVTLLIGIYVGGISGGLITATLLRIPGEPASVMTTLDGYPMARSGRPGRALGLGITASFVGGAISWIPLVLISPFIAAHAVKLGPFENFAIVMTAIVLIASVNDGAFVKGLLSGFFGMLVSMPGIDEASGTLRLTFGFSELDGGFGLLPVLIGMFALNQVLADTADIESRFERVEARLAGIWIGLRDIFRQAGNMVRSACIGIAVGVLPGLGANVGSIIAYTATKNLSRTPERFGKGADEGIVASETANNASIGGGLIPVLTLGIPGGLIDSVLLGALMIHNLQPGPLLFVNNPEVVYAVMAAHLSAHGLMYAMMALSCAFVLRLMYLERAYLFPIVLVFCVAGAYAVGSSPFDMWIMVAFGAVGLAMELARFPLAPFVIGFVLAPLAEKQLRAGLMSSDGDWTPLLTQPISAFFLMVALALCLWPAWRALRRRSVAAL